MHLLALLFLCLVQMGVEANESALSGELELSTYIPRVEGETVTFSQEVYIEQVVTESGFAITLNGYRDQWFWSAYAGGAQYIFDDALEIGIGVGAAHYSSETRFSWVPWFYYENDWILAEGEADFYHGKIEDTYYRGKLLAKVHESVLLGVGAEQAVGVGPMANVQLGNNVVLEAVVPMADKPLRDEQTKFVIRIAISF